MATKVATVSGGSAGKNSFRFSAPLSSVMTAVGFMRRASLGDDLHGLHAVADLDPVHDVHAAHDPAEGGVLAVQAPVVGEHHEDLAARGVRVRAARHADDASDELALAELRGDRVARPAGAHVRLVERTRPGLGIPDLDDEVRDDAVEPLAWAAYLHFGFSPFAVAG